MVQEFSNPRELFSQMGLNLEVLAGRIGTAFRAGIRKDLEGLSNDKAQNAIVVKVSQNINGTTVSLQIAEWIEPIKKAQLQQKFKAYLESIGARKGACTGPMPVVLGSLINKNLSSVS
jgi:hypothetical protein